MKGDITRDPASIKRIIKFYYEKNAHTSSTTQMKQNNSLKKKTGTTKTHVKMKQDNLKNPMTAKEI